MLYCSNQLVQFLLSGCLTVFIVSSVVKAEGRVFVLDQRNLRGFREAEQACALQNARLASVEELRQAVVECFFSHCTRGWLYGGTVGTTVCNTEGSSLKALNVRTENATEDTAHLGAFCIKDKAGACGDPPFFPNTRLQDYSGFEIGDELLYMCTPGYVMPSGHTAFSLLCDSCGEWYGTVQICAKDPVETHVDYEDKFEDSYGEADHDHDSQEEVFGDVSQDGKRILQQQEPRFSVNVEGNQPNLHKVNNSGTFERTVDETTKREQDAFTVRPRFEQDRPKLVQTGAAAATEEPVSLLSQKHMFWFPQEAFQEEIPPIASTQATQRASGARSEESKETESQERLESIDPVDDDGDPDNDDLDRNDDRDDERDIFEDPGDDIDDNDDHDDSRHLDRDIHEDDHTDDHDDPDSRQEEDFNDNVKQPGHYDDLDRPDQSKEDANDHDDRYDMGEHEDDRDRTHKYSERDDAYDDHPSKEDHEDHPSKEDHEGDDHDDHYDMGEHEDDRDRTREYDDRDDAYDDHLSKEDHEDHPSKEDHEDDHRDNDGEHPDNSKEHAETDDHDGERYDHDEDDIYDDHEDKDEESYDDHDSHEKTDDHLHLIISVANERHPNITQREAGGKSTKENAWLDGYPVDVFDTKTGDSTKGHIRPNGAKTTDKPNDMEARERVPHISLSDKDLSSTTAPKSDQGREKKGWFRFRTPSTSSDHLNSPSYSDTLDYDTQEVAPTHSLQDDLTNHPFLDHGPAPPVHDGNTFPGAMEEHSVDNLPGEMGEIEGEKKKTICVGEDCPPHPPTSNTQGAKVAAIIVAVCAVATAVIIGVWCYRRKQQKSSLYEMNGKGQSQSGQGQQIEMQQKV